MLTLHLAAALASDLLLMIAAVLSLAYLMQDHLLRRKKIRSGWRLPSIHVLDDWGLKLLSTAFVLMTVGIAAGSVLAYQHWGPRWYLDARQIWSTATWMLFAVVLLARFTVGWRGRRAAWVTLVGVTLVITGLLGLNYVSWTKHRSEIIAKQDGFA